MVISVQLGEGMCYTVKQQKLDEWPKGQVLQATEIGNCGSAEFKELAEV